jgi:hypothetical protein
MSHEMTTIRPLFPLRFAALLAAALAIAVSATASADHDGQKFSDKRLSKWLKGELRDQGLEPKGVSSCRPKRAKKVMLCKWRASGVFPGEVAYECAGKARFTVRGKDWQIDPCNNVIEPMMPLKPEVGPHPMFGYNDDWVQQVTKLDLLAGSGANIARTGLFWDAVQPTSVNVHNWAIFDALYSQMLSRGVRPLFILYAAPCWAQAGSCRQGAHPSAEYYDELADFAARAAQRYPQAAGIEVWNEPNYEIYWGGTPDPESYGEMLKAVIPAIKAANPEMPVVTAGLSPHQHDVADAMAYETFLRRAYATGGPQLADAIGTHPYPLRQYHEDFLGAIRIDLFRYFRVMSEYGEASKPMWITETGVSNEGEGEEDYSHEQQADALTRIYTVIRRIDHPIPVAVFHRFADQPGSAREKERGYGVVSGGGSPKPAYCAMAAARDLPC